MFYIETDDALINGNQLFEPSAIHQEYPVLAICSAI